MSISEDEAREALAQVSNIKNRATDFVIHQQIGPSLVAVGWTGAFAFGLQSSFIEILLGKKLLSDFTGGILILAWSSLPLVILYRIAKPIALKFDRRHGLLHVAGFLVGLAILFAINGPAAQHDVAAQVATMCFAVGLSPMVTQMLWLGRLHAFGALAILSIIGVICIFLSSIETRYSCLALFNGLVLFPGGIWLIAREGRSRAR